MNININTFAERTGFLFKNTISRPLTSLQLKICGVAALIFGLLATCYQQGLLSFKWNGEGTSRIFGYVRKGNFRNGRLNGEGEESGWGYTKTGTFANGQLVKGKETVISSYIEKSYEGTFKNGSLCQGTKISLSGLIKEEGEFEGEQLKKGKRIVHPTGVTEEGEFETGFLLLSSRLINGTYTLPDGRIAYVPHASKLE